MLINNAKGSINRFPAAKPDEVYRERSTTIADMRVGDLDWFLERGET